MGFLKGAWAGATEPYNQAGEAGKPWEAVSRLGLDVASFFVGAGEAKAGMKAARAGQVVNNLDKANDLAKTGDVAWGGKTVEQHLIEQSAKKFQELERDARRSPKDPQFIGRKQRGPCLSAVIDTTDPDMVVHTGLNDLNRKPPTDIPDFLKKRIEVLEVEWKKEEARILDKEKKDPESVTEAQRRILRAGLPGFHSELYALPDSIKARKARTNIPVTEESLPGFLLHNTDLGNKHLGQVKPRCVNCNSLTDGVRLTGPQQEADDIFHSQLNSKHR